MELTIFSDITVLFALPDEARAFQATKISKQVRVAISGMGAANTIEAMELLFRDDARGEILLVCGFAGGLQEDLPVGTVVMVESVTSSEAPKKVFKADARLLSAATSVAVSDLKIVKGKLASVQKVLTTGDEKRACAKQTGAIAVDMETFAAMKTAKEMGVRCLAVRVITDVVDDTLPLDFNAFTNAQGEPDRGKIIAHLLLHPRKILPLIRLGARAGFAAKNLAAFLDGVIESL